MQKILQVLSFFADDVISRVGFWLRWSVPEPQLQEGSILLKFLLETSYAGYLVKSWGKIAKI